MRINKAQYKKLVGERAAADLPPLTKRTFELPMPPSANHLFSTARVKLKPSRKHPRGGVSTKRHRSKQYNQWALEAILCLKRQNVRGTAPIPCEVFIDIRGGKGFEVNRDLDNCNKSILDLLVANGILTDDNVKHVTKVCTTYFKPIEGVPALCEVQIQESRY